MFDKILFFIQNNRRQISIAMFVIATIFLSATFVFTFQKRNAQISAPKNLSQTGKLNLQTPAPTIKPTVTPTIEPTATPTIVYIPSNINGNVFQDKNSNGVQDNGEPGLDAMIEVNIFVAPDRIEKVKTATAGKDGKFGISLNGPAKYSLIPLHYTFFTPQNSQIFSVSGLGEDINVSFPYIPNAASGGLKLYVYNDKNENGGRDEGEETISYGVAAVSLPDSTVEKYAIPPEGMDITHIPFGHYKIELIPADQSYAYYFKITKGVVETDLSPNSDRAELYLGAHKLY
jgi:hypothetical protein